MLKYPLDKEPYKQDPRSRPIDLETVDGTYVYVQDAEGTIWILTDGPHLHPKVLGGGQPALYAGDMRIKSSAIFDLTNLSGTFQFDDVAGLERIASSLEAIGYKIKAGAVRMFHESGKTTVVR